MSPLALVEGLLLGVAIGVILGTVGAGGAILAAPGLILLLGVSPTAATTSSLIVVIAGALAGLIPRLRSTTVDVRLGLLFAGLGAGGTVVGSLLAPSIPQPVTVALFAALMYCAAFLMWRPPGLTAPLPRRGWPRTVLAATAVGLLTGVLGVGGGFLIVPVLVLALGVSPGVATGTSLVAIAAGGGLALLARAPTWPLVPWPTVTVVGLAAVLTGLLAAPLAQRLPAAATRRLFGGIVVAIATVMLLQLAA